MPSERKPASLGERIRSHPWRWINMGSAGLVIAGLTYWATIEGNPDYPQLQINYEPDSRVSEISPRMKECNRTYEESGSLIQLIRLTVTNVGDAVSESPLELELRVPEQRPISLHRLAIGTREANQSADETTWLNCPDTLKSAVTAVAWDVEVAKKLDLGAHAELLIQLISWEGDAQGEVLCVQGRLPNSPQEEIGESALTLAMRMNGTGYEARGGATCPSE